MASSCSNSSTLGSMTDAQVACSSSTTSSECESRPAVSLLKDCVLPVLLNWLESERLMPIHHLLRGRSAQHRKFDPKSVDIWIWSLSS